MNAIKQHIPDFCEGFEKALVEFNTLEELLAIDFVKKFSTFPKFHQFSMNDGHMIAEYRGGREWWVVGRIREPVEGLPAWNHGIYEIWDKNEPKEVSGREVAWSCGDSIKLRDGNVVRRRHP